MSNNSVNNINNNESSIDILTEGSPLSESPEELAEKMGITLKSVSYIECGLTYPSQENIFKLAEILDMSLDEFVFSRIRFNDMLDMGEINNMLNNLSADDQEMVINIVKATCESIRNRNEKSK